MDESRIPNNWRDATVTPLFKKGSKAEPGNYSPISLTSATGKLMEKLVESQLERHLKNKQILRVDQPGFRHRRSSTTNLIDFLERVTQWQDQGKPFDTGI